MCEDFDKKIDLDKLDKEEQSELHRNRVIYSLPVRTGYWANELAIREQTEFFYNYKKEHCQLLIQKSRKMFRNLLRPTLLAQDCPHVEYNKNYQIRSYGIAEQSACGMVRQTPLNLSGVITERDVESSQHFTHGCVVSSSPYLTPCVRNTFVIVGCDKPESGMVNYGDDVYIRIVESDFFPLYLCCENSTMQTFGKRLIPYLSQNLSFYCRFKILHWNTLLRNDTLGTSVAHNQYVVIQNSASGLNLSTEYYQRMPTFFGNECVVTCYNFRDTHRRETSENFWKIVGLQRRDTKGKMQNK